MRTQYSPPSDAYTDFYRIYTVTRRYLFAHQARCAIVVLLVTALVSVFPVSAQEIPDPDLDSITDPGERNKLDRLQAIGGLIKTKRTQRDELAVLLRGNASDGMHDERERLNSVMQDLDRLRTSFELALLEDVDIQLMSDTEAQTFDWRDELVEVVEPLLSSLKSMTKRPRQMAELRKVIDLESQKLAVAEQALATVNEVPVEALNEGAAIRLQATREKWNDTYDLVNERLLSSRSQLARLKNSERSFVNSVTSGMQDFLTGRGLTLFIAIAAAVAGCGFMRLCWHLFNTRLTKKSVRRKATWYRLLAYSFHLLTLLLVVGIVLTVLYLRQDVLLMGLAFLALATALISLRAFLPRFLKEVRYLLNLGAVREDECVIHDDLPWQVMSLNMLTVLRNPALDGVIRLPLEVMTAKVSRPVVRDESWFPTHRNDFIILPDRTFGQVLSQTPGLVSLSVKGGMSMTVTTAEFYSTSVMNLSRSNTYGIAVNFGLDYSLQDISLSTIPDVLKESVNARLEAAGYRIGKDITNVLVEFAAASDSSIDFLIYTTVSSARASDYFAIERQVQQACVAAANQNEWQIPFPQLTLHHQPSDTAAAISLKRAA